MKKIYLILICLMVVIGAHAQWSTYTANGVTWKYMLDGANAIILGETLGKDAFTGALNIPDHVEGGGVNYPVVRINGSAFSHYVNANSLTIPPSVTVIDQWAFNGCTGLMGPLSLPNVTAIKDGAFSQCSGFTSLSAPKVVSIGQSAFYQCSGLTGALSLPEVTNIDRSAFYYCSGFTSLSLPKVTTIKEVAFSGCTGFTGALLLQNVTIIEKYTFSGCSGLTSLSLPNVTTIGEAAFNLCSGLTGTLSLPKVVTIGDAAFQNCPLLTDAFFPEVITIGEGTFWATLTDLPFMPKVETIGRSAFSNNQKLIGIKTLPASLKNLGNNAFNNCHNIEAIVFGNGTNLNSIGQHVFSASWGLKYINMTGVTLPAGTKIGRVFASPFDNTPKYTMVYLPAGSPTPEANQENFVIGNTCEHFVVYDKAVNYKSGTIGCNYPIKYPFTANKASYMEELSYMTLTNKSFSGDNCKTLCLPYPATLPNGMRAYELTAKVGDGKYFRFVSIGDGGTQLEANKPYLIRITDGGTHTFGTETNVQVPVTPPTIEVPASADGTTFFGGKTENIDNATAAAGGYYNLENNTWEPIKTDNPNGYVHSFRAYIRSTSPTPAKGFAIVLDDENETTGIDNAEEDIEKGDGKIYSLDGKLLGTDINALKSGEIYIKNGKKFYKF